MWRFFRRSSQSTKLSRAKYSKIVATTSKPMGKRAFNGVAILSKLPLEDVARGLPGDDSDEQARWIEATVVGEKAVRVCGLYLPNGNPVPGPKYDYKLAWMKTAESPGDGACWNPRNPP